MKPERVEIMFVFFLVLILKICEGLQVFKLAKKFEKVFEAIPPFSKLRLCTFDALIVRSSYKSPQIPASVSSIPAPTSFTSMALTDRNTRKDRSADRSLMSSVRV